MAYICNDDAVDSCFGSVRQLEPFERNVFKGVVCDTDALQEKFSKWVSSRAHLQQQAEKGSSKHRKQKVRREQFNAALNKLFGKYRAIHISCKLSRNVILFRQGIKCVIEGWPLDIAFLSASFLSIHSRTF